MKVQTKWAFPVYWDAVKPKTLPEPISRNRYGNVTAYGFQMPSPTDERKARANQLYIQLMLEGELVVPESEHLQVRNVLRNRVKMNDKHTLLRSRRQGGAYIFYTIGA